jgi:hypothetical protein
MIHGLERAKRDDEQELAALATDLRVRVLNCAASGCLVESSRPLVVGSVATLRIAVLGGEFEDTVQVVRCQEITGGGAVYHIGAEFLPTAPPWAGTLRYLMRRETGDLKGWLMNRR